MNKRQFAIVADSACDMPTSYYQEKGVELIKLGFMMNDVNYEGEDGESISEKEFYKLLREGSMPTTYQVTAEAAKPHVEKYLQQGEDVLILAFSSALSGTANSLVMAAKELSVNKEALALFEEEERDDMSIQITFTGEEISQLEKIFGDPIGDKEDLYQTVREIMADILNKNRKVI